MKDSNFVMPSWASPAGVNALVTTAAGGVSQGPWATMNLGLHTGDDAIHVEANRQRLRRQARLPAEPNWLTQVHGTRCAVFDDNSDRPVEADAAWTDQPGVVLAIMVADCLPVFIASRCGAEIAVVHAGWRGLATGVIESAVKCFTRQDLVAWLGPAIGPCHYEVDAAVKAAFDDDTGFLPGKDDAHWMLNLYAAATRRLERAGVSAVFGGGFCTWCENRFFSYRRDGVTGRMAALIWRDA